MGEHPPIYDADMFEAELRSESESRAKASAESLLKRSPESEPKRRTGDEVKKNNSLNSLEIDRTCIRPMNTDDIISKELPFKILDTDFDGKEDDCFSSSTESTILDVPTAALHDSNDDRPGNLLAKTLDESHDNEPGDLLTKTLDESHDNEPGDLLTKTLDERNGDEPGDLLAKTLDEQFKADIIEQDTGYSSDLGENVKSASSERIDRIETNDNENTNQGARTAGESIEPVTNGVVDTDSILNTSSQISLVKKQGITGAESGDFVPTIVGIRGAVDSLPLNETNISNSEAVSVRTPSESPLQQINIVKVQGSSESNGLNSTPEEIFIVDDGDDTEKVTASFSTDVDIKQEPPEMAHSDDCPFDSTQSEETRFTSEIFIEEDRANDKEKEEEEEEEDNDDDEVICLESSGKIPQPIPIKKETHIDGGEQHLSSQCTTASKENNCSTTLIRNLPVVTNAVVYSTAGYTCHMCNMTFQEYELLNDHMTLHRNNLVDPNKMKPKAKPICPICNRQLSTFQSLQQHIRTHNEEKPHVCNICGKAFRHQNNYRIHLQKHEAEKAQKARSREAVRKNVPLAPRVAKPISYTYATQVVNPALRTCAPKSSFSSSPSSFRRQNTKENVNLPYSTFRNRGELITRTRIVDDLDDDVIPLKTFNNVENIVMNAARFIVKVDSIDANMLKRRIKTPDISIDKNAVGSSRRLGEKSKIVLSSSDNSKRLKLDQIENIIIDNDIEMDQTPAVSSTLDDDDRDYDYGDDYVGYDSDVSEGVDSSNKDSLPALVNNDHKLKNKTQIDHVSELRRNAQMILKSEAAEKLKNSQSNSPNVIMLTTRVPSPTPSPIVPRPNLSARSFIIETPHESYTNEISDDEISTSDSFDKAFHRVALRRLRLIRKLAAKNGGKVDKKYSLGPLFWRKALRRAKLNVIDFDDNNVCDSNASQQSSISIDSAKFGKPDERYTNDPKRLQMRAETKLSFMLNKVRLTNDMNNLNLMGPLFWKRTLQLAGVHYPQDLPALLCNEPLSLQDVEFVDDEFSTIKKDKKTSTNSCRAGLNPSDFLHTTAQLEAKNPSDTMEDEKKCTDTIKNCDSTSQNSKLVESILSDVVLPRSPPNQVEVTTDASKLNVFAKNSSILYESLTRPRTISSKSTDSDSAVTSNTNEKVEENGNVSSNTEFTSSSPVTDAGSEMVNTNCTSEFAEDEVAQTEANTDASGEVDPNVDGTNIVLNVDENFQLIATDGGKLADLSDGSNYVLVSDESGAMQLVKENDLRLVESNDANGDTQYVVNLHGENYANLDLMGQVNGEQQLSYALQFDGENYTAIQLVQNDVAGEAKEDNVDDATVALKAIHAGQTAGYVLPAVTTDLNSIGKELSDFLNLNYNVQ